MKLFDISSWCKNGLELTSYPLLGEIDLNSIDIGEIIEIGHQHFTAGVIDKQNDSVGVHKVSYNLNPEEKSYENDLVCPYCGYKDSDAFELPDDDGTIKCGRCGAEIRYTRNIEITYSTEPVKPPKVIRGKWKNDNH